MASSPSSRRREVAGLLGNMYREQPPHLHNGRVRVHDLIILRQPRVTIDRAYIRELADNIRLVGLLKPPLVVRYSPERFQRYLRLLNHVWHTRYHIRQFKPTRDNGHPAYYVLIAGECRMRAVKLLDWPVVDARLGRNVDAIIALFQQNAENTYTPPAEHEQAFAYQRLWTVIREADPTFPLAAFARHVKRSPDTIRRALQFCELPDRVQFAVKNGELIYGLAVQLTRLNGRVTTEELLNLMQVAIINRTQVVEFRAQISRRLMAITTEQGDLLADLMTTSQLQAAQRAARRRTVDKEYTQALSAALRYIQLISGLVQRGELGTNESPYSDRSVRKRMRDLVDAFEAELPHIRKVMRRADIHRATSIIPKIRRALG